MNKVWKIARHTFEMKARRLGFLVVGMFRGLAWLCLGLAFVYFLFKALSKPDWEPPRIGVLDRGGRSVPIPQPFAGRFVSMKDDESARKALAAGEVSAVLVIPADYPQAGKVTAWQGSSSLSLDDATAKEMQDYLVARLLDGKVDALTASRVREPVEFHAEALDSDGQPRSHVEVQADWVGLGLALVLAWFVYFSWGSLHSNLAEERSRGMLELLLSSVSPAQLLAGKAIGLLLYRLMVLALLLLGAVLIARGFAHLLGQWIALKPQFFLLAGAYYLLGTMLFAIPALAILGLPKSGGEAWGLLLLLLLLVAAPFVLLFVLDSATWSIARLLSLYPPTAPGFMLFRLAVGPVPLLDVCASIMLLLVSIPLGFCFSVKLFRTGMLLDGRPPGLRELLRTFRQA